MDRSLNDTADFPAYQHDDSSDDIVVPAAEQYALVIAWSATQPERVGEVAVFPEAGKTLIVGRGDLAPETRAWFVRQRPGETGSPSPLDGPSLSRRQISVRAISFGLEIQVIGDTRTFVNGHGPRPRSTTAVLVPGDTVRFGRELLLQCIKRRTMLPCRFFRAEDLRAFGEPDAAGFVGESPAAWALREAIAGQGQAWEPIMVLGAPGTGKALVAAATHRLSDRADQPLVRHRGGCLPLERFPFAFFGHVANYPHTGTADEPGLVGAAGSGTLLVEEIAGLPRGAQLMLNRILDPGREYRRCGEDTCRSSDGRVIATTSRDESAFEPSFYSRFMNRIYVPSLFERREDIPLLVRHFLLERAEHNPDTAGRFVQTDENGRRDPRVDPRVIDHVIRSPLAGNVRELQRLVVEAIMWTEPGEVITRPPHWGSALVPEGAEGAEFPTAEQIERTLLQESGSVTRAAAQLGLRDQRELERVMRRIGMHEREVTT